MAGYLGSKAVLLSTTAATVTGNATVGGSLTAASATVSGDLTVDTDTLYVDSANNRVGVRTTSPASDLHIENATSAGLRLIGSTTGANTIYLGDTDSGSAGYIQYNNNSDYMRFAAGGAERARIDSSGNLLVGTTVTQTAGFLGVVASGSSGTMHTGKDSTSGRTHFGFWNPNGQVGNITTSGSTTSYNTSSDYRLKEDWQPLTGASERVLALNPVSFAWKSDGSRVDGFLAHEAQVVVPEAVHGEKDAVDEDGNPVYQGIDQSKLVPLLTAALQEALTEIAALKDRVTALEAN